MPRRAMRASVEITAHAVTCPGTWLPRRDDVYVSITMLGQTRRTLYTSPIFPLLFHDKFYFDKVFYSCFEPTQVNECLEDHLVLVELVQLSDIYEGGRLLASYECNARDFLYPFPTFSSSYGTHDREVLLERTLDFPGICPRFEFSTKTVIEEVSAPALDYYTAPGSYTPRPRSRSPSPARRSRSRTRGRGKTPKSTTYERPTISSISRSRSMSPTRRRFDTLSVSDDVEDRPPFVVRKVNSPALIGRKPGTPHPRSRAASPCNHSRASTPRVRRQSLPSAYTDDYIYTYRPSTSYGQAVYDGDLDAEVNRILSKPTSSYVPPYRPTSPLVERYSRALSPMRSMSPSRALSPLRSLSPSRADMITARVDRALARARSVERLNRTLDDVDLERARHRREDQCIGTISEYWDSLAEEQTGRYDRDRFHNSLDRIYSDLNDVYKRAKSRTQYLQSMC